MNQMFQQNQNLHKINLKFQKYQKIQNLHKLNQMIQMYLLILKFQNYHHCLMIPKNLPYL